MQELLEVMGIPYTGSGRVGLHPRRRQGAGQARDARPRDPDARLLRLQRDRASRASAPAQALPAIEERLRVPDRRQARPPGLGARDQVRAHRRPTCPAALVAAFSYDRKVLLERYVAGRELAVSHPRGRTRSAAWRCRSSRRCPSRRTSTTSSRATRSAAPASSARPSSTRRWPTRASEIALETYALLGCAGFARVDLMLERGDRRAVRARGQPDPGADRDQPAAPGGRGGGDLVRRARRAGAGGGAAAESRSAGQRRERCERQRSRRVETLMRGVASGLRRGGGPATAAGLPRLLLPGCTRARCGRARSSGTSSSRFRRARRGAAGGRGVRGRRDCHEVDVRRGLACGP